MNNNSTEWKVDECGRRYRNVGKSIEYEEMVTVAGGFGIPISQLEDYNRRRKEAEEERRKKALEELANRPPLKHCPFSSGVNTDCKREKCVLFSNGQCSIAIIADNTGVTADEQDKNAKCPFSVYSRCNICALNNGGCAFVRLAAATNN